MNTIIEQNLFFEGVVSLANIILLLPGMYLTNLVIKQTKKEVNKLWNLVLFFIVLLALAQVAHVAALFNWFHLPGGSATIHLVIIAALLYKLLTTQKTWKID